MADDVVRFITDFSDHSQRLDQYIAAHLQGCSRSYAARLIRTGSVHVSGVLQKPSYQMRAGDVVEVRISAPVPTEYSAEAIPLDVLFEDTHIIVINKPPGMVVHPAPGHVGGTLVNALLHHCPDLQGIGGEQRPGIVHRLDKDTSGVLIAAKTQTAHTHLARQFKSRQISKVYLALVCDSVTADKGVLDFPIGRHPTQRKKMSIHSRKTRTAETHWEVSERFDAFTLLKLRILTGRTHQIRVHCAAWGHPVAGDLTYGGRKSQPRSGKRSAPLLSLERQLLHAWRLGIRHPLTQAPLQFEAPVPADMIQILDTLRRSN